MNIPKKIKVGYLTYSVVMDDKQFHDANESWGHTSHKYQRISLDPDVTEERKNETFLHELLHVCYHTSGLDAIDTDKLDQESIVRILTKSLYSVLKDNHLQF